MILLTKSPGSSKSFQEAPRKVHKISGQKYRNNSVGFLEEVLKPKGHFEINRPLGISIRLGLDLNSGGANMPFFTHNYLTRVLQV